jgi:protein disulfide-isomerase
MKHNHKMTMKKIIIATLLVGGFWLQVQATELNWSTDANTAVKRAKIENKLVLVDFTGSDWCGWCKKFDAEALSTEEFAAYAKTNLMLVQLDFPRSKPQSDALKAVNKAMAKQFKPGGFPTFIVLNGDGKELGRQTGYKPGGAAAFIKKIERFKSENE